MILPARYGEKVPADIDAGSLSQLLARVADGDHVAYEELYRRAAPLLLAACRRISPDRAEAEEAFQDAFLAIWHRAGTFDPLRGTAVAWLLTLARNRAVDRVRAGARHQGLPIAAADIVHDPARSAAEAIEDAEDDARLQMCMAELAVQDLRLIRAAYLERQGYAALSGQEGLPIGTIKTRIRRALLKLRECLQ